MCKGFGHKASQCRNKPDLGPPSIGDGKKAGTEPDAGAKLSKGAIRRLNQARKKEEEEKQKAEADAAKKATGIKTSQE